LLHPECTVRNCFGDSYPHALCPANPDVRRYLAGLCGDLANNLPLHAVQLESPGYMGLRHGHHHERDLTVLTPLEDGLMDLCFCPDCCREARQQDVDPEEIRHAACDILEAAMRAAPGRPADHPSGAGDLEESIPGLGVYRAMRKSVEDSLLREIRTALSPSRAELWLLGGWNPEAADVIDGFYAGVYGQNAVRALESVRRARAPISADRTLHAGIRLGLNSVADEKDLTEIVGAVREGGADGVMFYNYSESPMAALNWIKPAIGVARSR
jgi:hypothetical protein